MRRLIPIIAIAILLAATSCAPEKSEVSCPRPENVEQLLKGADLILSHPREDNRGIFFLDVAPDSFWACAGIQANDLITDVNSRIVEEGPELLELLELITQGHPLEFSVRDVSGDRRIIAIR